ncbi:hypothetical protein J1N35_023897 [Gossypium stocksii]|uniref:Legume lectin domain-containing protein n=1 Tax=Gossypium stocksii TaxID=47602 RepID=A0A9D3VK07_9ROSI|nr:hypothetical protein J1N35_023897 [Gossypium stocksii]
MGDWGRVTNDDSNSNKNKGASRAYEPDSTLKTMCSGNSRALIHEFKSSGNEATPSKYDTTLDMVGLASAIGRHLAVVDGRLGKRFVMQEVELVWKLGLLCSHPVVAAKPSMSSVITYLDSVASLPDELSSVIKAREFPGGSNDELISERNNTIPPLTITESFVSYSG